MLTDKEIIAALNLWLAAYQADPEAFWEDFGPGDYPTYGDRGLAYMKALLGKVEPEA